MAEVTHELEELTAEEMEKVAGGIIPVIAFGGYQILGALITVISGAMAAGELVEMIKDGDGSSSGGGSDYSGPGSSFGSRL